MIESSNVINAQIFTHINFYINFNKCVFRVDIDHA